jgi:hypothetical protein
VADPLVERVTFAGGEIGRALKARTDLARYQISVEAMENFVVMVEGGATRTPGTRFVGVSYFSPEKALLIPFRFTATDSYMIVLQGSQLQFIRSGAFVEVTPGTRLQIGVSWIEADLPNIRTVARGNVIFVASGRLPVTTIIRQGLTSWAVVPFLPKGGPFDLQNLDQAQTVLVQAIIPGQDVTQVGATVRVFTSGAQLFNPGHVNGVWRFDEADLSFISEWAADEPLTVGELRRYNGNVYEAVGGLRTGINPPTHTFGIVRSDSTDGGIWKFRHGDHGVVRITQYEAPTQVVGTVEKAIPISISQVFGFRWWKGSWSDADGHPTNLSWANQRLWVFRGDRFWASSSVNPEDFEEGEADDSAFSGKLLSPEAHGSLVQIQWAASSGNLVIGTSDVEWRVSGGAQGGPITGKTVTPTPDSKEGSIAHVPAVVDDSIIFIGRSGKRLNRAKIDIGDSGSNKLGTDEPSVGVRDIFEAQPEHMAWQRDPHRILWMQMKDGTLAGMTWMEKQKVLAIHHHPMVNAIVEDIAAIPGAGEDQVYMVVRRNIMGTQLRYLEQLQPFFRPQDLNLPTAEGAWFVDCGLAGSFAVPSTTVSGLDHLNGQQVAVLADGAMQSPKTVLSGRIGLDRPARNVIVGLPKIAYLLDLPRDVSTQGGPTIGQEKAIREINLYLDLTAGGRVGAKPKEGQLPTEPINETGDKAYHTPIDLISGLRRMEVECDIQEEVQLFVLCEDALPCSILGLSPRLQVEET